MNKKKWYEYLWLWSVVYLLLGSVNILFAWLGMIDFVVPLLFAAFGGNKLFCNRYCGKGQLLEKLGSSCGCSRYHATPDILTAKRFRYGFLCFFMGMFGIMLWKTYLVAVGADSLSKTVTLLWTFHLPWDFA